MARRRRYQPVARIRRALLLALILFSGGLAGYYLTGSLGSGEDREGDSSVSDERFSLREGLMTVAQGFDYEVTDGEELAFRVKAAQLLADAEDRMELDKVRVELPQEGGGTVVVVGDRGTIHLDSKSATLDGDVIARNSDGVELRGEAFEVIREGKQLVSRAPVTFGSAGEYQGTAKELSYSIKKERLVMEKDVVIQGLPKNDPQAGSIRCDRLTYDRLEGTLRLEGNVRLARGHEFLEAARVSLTFGEGESDLRSVRADGGVEGRYVPQASGDRLDSRVDFSGRVLYAAFEPGTRQARQAELRGRQEQIAVLDVVDASGLSRVFSSPLLSADFVNGEIRTAQASDPVVIVERHAFAPGSFLRRVCSETALAQFDGLGELQTLTLDGNVDYQAVDMQAQGDRVVARNLAGTVSIVGRPATVVTEQGNLMSPTISYAESGSIFARDGVRAELRQEAGATLMGGESKEPVRITAERAQWDETPPRVTFTERVRAWQGRDYLLADEMVGEPELDQMTATGKVKTVVRRGPDQTAASQEDQAPIEITAKKLIYKRPLRVITYTGDAKAVQTGRTLECNEMDVELDEADEFDRLVCTGDLQVEDPAQGKEVRGDRAIYVPSRDEVDVTGDPVVLTDKDGTELRGGRILYHFGTGAAQIGSRPEAPADGSGGTG